MIADLLFVLPAVFVGAVLIMSVASGKAWDAPVWQVPKIVSRNEDPRKYWSAIWMTAVVFAVAVWIAWSAISN